MGSQGSMSSRDRVLSALNFRIPDRLPKDLGGMRSTGISAFAYPKLVKALGLPYRLPKIHDTGQMLALPDMDVLDALGCDVVTIDGGISNAVDEPQHWHPYDFNGRLPALVRNPKSYSVAEDGTVLQHWGGGASRMPVASYVFDWEHGGQPLLDFNAPLPLMDLKRYKTDMDAWVLTDKEIEAAVSICKRTREATDKAVFYTDHLNARISIMAHGGLGVFPVICLLEPDYVEEYHSITVEAVIRNMKLLLPEIKDYIDIALTGCDDWGTQNAPIASPEIYQKLFLPYFRMVNDAAHAIAPELKTFIHTCGAVYDLLDMMADSGFDIINPIQWTAGGHSYTEWKDRLRNKAAMWGGGVNAQHTLPFGTIEELTDEAGRISSYLSTGGGYVFNCIHNLLAEVDPEKVIAMYKAADRIDG